MNDEIWYLLLQAEKEYDNSVKNAVKAAEDYAGERRKEQSAYIENLKLEWQNFEKSENNKLIETLSENERKLEIKAAELKNLLKISQKKKAELISERLKEEVLSLYGNS